MEFILDHTDEEIKKAETKMYGVGGQGMDGLPHGRDVKSFENRIISGIEEIDVLKERYRQAKEYMTWFEPAWENLTDDERYVLDAFYMSGGTQESGAILVADHYNIDRSSAFRRKNRAVDHMSLMLYGKS